MPSSQSVGQLPSHVSPFSTTPLPQTGWQSLSLFAFAPGGQQPSVLRGRVMGLWVHIALQRSVEPTATSDVHASASSQVAGQLPSQVSPRSTMRLPHTGWQSESLFALAPGGQQPSPLFDAVMAICVHATLHCSGVPVITSSVQAFPSSHELGHGLSLLLGSHSSGASTTPSPQLLEQSVSSGYLQPLAQQPSPLVHVVISCVEHTASQVSALPSRALVKQLSTALQVSSVGHDPAESQVSPGSS